MRKRAAFTLIEIMIVVAIIVLLASITVPVLLRVRIDANETAAISTMRAFSAAAQSYRADHGRYPRVSVELSSDPSGKSKAYCAAAPGYLDDQLACEHWGEGCYRDGYRFQIQRYGTTYTFSALGQPDVYRITGVRSFLVDESGVIRWTNTGNYATRNDKPL